MCSARIRATVLLLVLLPLACRRPVEQPRATYGDAPVIIISIDTLRADRLPMFGYEAVETPHLDRFRADSILFRNAYTHAPLTLPAHASVLTGLLPTEHKVRNNIGYVLSDDIPTLPRMLKAKGYATAAAVSAYVLRGSTGLARDFDEYDDGIPSRGQAVIGQLQRSGRVTVAAAVRWIESRRDAPFFYMLHIFEPHSPYEPEEPFRSRYRDRYDGEVATADAIIGEFLDRLRSLGVYDKAIIILMSDHGEGLGDHGEAEHGIFVYRETIHVPLLLKLPGASRKGEEVVAPVALIDIAPTVASLTGMSTPTGMRGRSLVEPAGPSRGIYAESLYPRIHLGWSELRSLVDSRYHYIEAPRSELYDIVNDPREKTNVLADTRRVASAMRAELARYDTEIETPQQVDPEEAKKLAALGYLSTPAAAGDGPLPDPKDRIGEVNDMIRATDLMQARKFDAAIAAFQRIVDRNPRFSDAWTSLGGALEGAGRYDEAADVYRRAIEIAPLLAGEFGLRRGNVLLRLERLDEAEQHARLAEATNPGAMYVLLARIELARQNFAAAEAQARAAANDPNYRLGGELMLAQILAQQGRAAEALPIVESVGGEIESQELGPIEAYGLIRGDVLARLERYEEAIEAFRGEIEHFPSNQQTYANLTLVYLLLDRPADAERTLEQMVRANPGPRSMLFAARTLENLGDARGAARWRQRAERLR
ncbi:MAG TPA: sulfatase-like hydrolase/transferase [Thermoanaerobaculia bacterium]|nr:sulfatase-like hydrolase/transferase [Thermoanaerobaculia bacterium]